jgi:hypothetical protein
MFFGSQLFDSYKDKLKIEIIVYLSGMIANKFHIKVYV